MLTMALMIGPVQAQKYFNFGSGGNVARADVSTVVLDPIGADYMRR
jgi:hypothetical protein